jgi:hypothetical protein
MGPQGIQGPAGIDGINGIDGAVGPMGPQGIQGPAGVDGINGIDGAVGATGPQGIAGVDGSVGPMGPQGIQGITGATGANGAVGATGPQGVAGATGATGAVGATGAAGSTNAWALTGSAGTSVATNYMGSSDAQDVAFKTNATEVMRLINVRKTVGIGTTTDGSAKLHVVTSTSGTNNSAYFEQKLLNGNTNVVKADYTGAAGNDDVIAYRGTAIANDWYGYGAYLNAGYIGAYTELAPTGNQTYYGFRTYIAGGTGMNHGIRSQVYNGRKSYGMRSYVQDADTSYGVFTQVIDNAGTNLNHGAYNIISANSSLSNNYGNVNIISATNAQAANTAYLGNITGGNGTANNTGLDLAITATGGGINKGSAVAITADDNSTNYGFFATLSGVGAAAKNYGADITAGVNTSSQGIFNNVAGIFTTYSGPYSINASVSYSSGQTGVSAISGSGTEVAGIRSVSSNNSAVSSYGVVGTSTSGDLSIGLLGEGLGGTSASYGVVGVADGGTIAGAGIYGVGSNGAIAGKFDGDVEVNGNTTINNDITVVGDMFVAGFKNFKIDHPLDPANKYLVHYCLEAPEAQNVYNGNITTDANGEAVVDMPSYFSAANTNFKYQLTVIGQFAQAIVGSEVKDNKFVIITDKPNVKVSWQVTATRNDAYAQKHGYNAEQDKPADKRGTYLAPELYGQPANQGTGIKVNSGTAQPNSVLTRSAEAAKKASAENHKIAVFPVKADEDTQKLDKVRSGNNTLNK